MHLQMYANMCVHKFTCTQFFPARSLETHKRRQPSISNEHTQNLHPSSQVLALFSGKRMWGSLEKVLTWRCCSAVSDSVTLVSSTPGFPVLHYLLEFAQTHIHWVRFEDGAEKKNLSDGPGALCSQEKKSVQQQKRRSRMIEWWRCVRGTWRERAPSDYRQDSLRNEVLLDCNPGCHPLSDADASKREYTYFLWRRVPNTLGGCLLSRKWRQNPLPRCGLPIVPGFHKV